MAYPLLEKFGFIGWFLVPTAFISAPPKQTTKLAKEFSIGFDQKYEDGRIALSWNEVRELDRKHVIGCHTHTHCRMIASVSEGKMDEEIAQAKSFLEKEIQHEVPIFGWVGGEDFSYSAVAAKKIRDSGYRYAFLTKFAPIRPHTDPFQLHRGQVDAAWPLEVIKFQLSGVMDVLYTRSRRRTNAITSA